MDRAKTFLKDPVKTGFCICSCRTWNELGFRHLGSIGIFFFIAVFFFSDCQTGQHKSEEKKDTLKTDTVLPKPLPKKVVRIPTNRIYNDIARYLAGMKGDSGSGLSGLETNPEWKKYALAFDTTWARFERRQLGKIMTWSESELSWYKNDSAGKPDFNLHPEIVFYPFSGPDFLNVFAFFPSAVKYIMIGLEPAGVLPEPKKFNRDSLKKYFSAIKTSLEDILIISFFKTNDMAIDFRKEELQGTLPVLLIFLARTGNEMVDARPVKINDSGEIVAGSFTEIKNANHKKNLGVEIVFQKCDTAPQKYLYYFSVDLYNESLKKTPGFLYCMEKPGTITTYIKSASYLMHKSYFSTIRSLILNRSAMVLQDDSGIPFKFFDPEYWNITLYGRYQRPIKLFSVWAQKNLKEAYKDSSKAKPLNFGIGYNWRQGNSNLMVARKK